MHFFLFTVPMQIRVFLNLTQSFTYFYLTLPLSTFLRSLTLSHNHLSFFHTFFFLPFRYNFYLSHVPSFLPFPHSRIAFLPLLLPNITSFFLSSPLSHIIFLSFYPFTYCLYSFSSSYISFFFFSSFHTSCFPRLTYLLSLSFPTHVLSFSLSFLLSPCYIHFLSSPLRLMYYHSSLLGFIFYLIL